MVMKKILFGSVLLVTIMSCNTGSSDNNTNDSVGFANPSAADTTTQPDAITNSSAISTDTAAMNTSNSYKKLDSSKK